MGTWWKAETVIGFQFSFQNMTETVIDKSCSHENDGHVFCPQCGKKVEMVESQKNLDENYIVPVFIHETKHPKGYNVASDGYKILVGRSMSCDRGDFKFMSLDGIDFEETKSTIEKMIEPVKHFIKQEGEFGLWSAMIGS